MRAFNGALDAFRALGPAAPPKTQVSGEDSGLMSAGQPDDARTKDSDAQRSG